MKQSVFKSEAGRDKFRAYYNQVLSQFPFEQKYINTKLWTDVYANCRTGF
jgi:hypothetical protein